MKTKEGVFRRHSCEKVVCDPGVLEVFIWCHVLTYKKYINYINAYKSLDSSQKQLSVCRRNKVPMLRNMLVLSVSDPDRQEVIVRVISVVNRPLYTKEDEQEA